MEMVQLVKPEAAKRILRRNSLAQHWARDWRALALTQVRQKNFISPNCWSLRVGEKLRREIGSGRRPRVGDG